MAEKGTKLVPRMGWTALSRSRLNRAEAQLVEGAQGVRDEVGVLALHTGYANRFFPGTSTQQTRLRYALFVPWQIQDLLRKTRSEIQARRELPQQELQLANRLQGESTGVIGRRNAKIGRLLAIPPSSAYWVALREWGILNPMPLGIVPSRKDMFDHWDKWREGQSGRAVTDDEGRALEVFSRLFANGIPDSSATFRGNGPLEFKLIERERRFLRTRLAETTRLIDGKPSFLAELVRAEVVPTKREQPWSRRILGAADGEDRQALKRARKAASLSVVARAWYAAAVETLQENDGVRCVTADHREHLLEVVAKHGAHATDLRLEDLAEDGVVLTQEFLTVLEALQQWALQDGKNPLGPALYRVMTDWEMDRKGSRSKLPRSKNGREARRLREDPDTASPINYRWPLVRNLLRDLNGMASGA